MAIQQGLFPFTGKLKGVIGYRRGDKYCLRSTPDQVHQSHRTRVASRNFGKASAMGRAIRHSLAGDLHLLPEDTMANRLTTNLLSILQEDYRSGTKRFIPRAFKGLKGFRFNSRTGINDLLPVVPTVLKGNGDNHLQVTIPAMANCIMNPAATHFEVTAIALSLQPGCGKAAVMGATSVVIDCTQPSGPVTLDLEIKEGALCCVVLEVMSCEMIKGKTRLFHNRGYNAADIIAVVRPARKARKKKRNRHRLPWKVTPQQPVSSTYFYQKE